MKHLEPLPRVFMGKDALQVPLCKSRVSMGKDALQVLLCQPRVSIDALQMLLHK